MSPNHHGLDYIYYRIYTEDGAVPSKTHFSTNDPPLGRINVRSIAPPRNVKAVKHSIEKMENIKDSERLGSRLFLSPFRQSPMNDADMVTIHDIDDPGSTTQKPLAFVAKFHRSALEYDGDGLPSAGEPNTTPTDIRYVHYLLYNDGDLMPSKMAIDTDSENPYVARIRADYIAPPHNLSSIKLYISRVEKNPALAHADLFEDESSAAPMVEGQVIFRTDGLGLSPEEPMVIALPPSIPLPADLPEDQSSAAPLVEGQALPPSIPIPDPLPVASFSDGRYAIKVRATGVYFGIAFLTRSYTSLYYGPASAEDMLKFDTYKWEIKKDASGNGNITINSLQSGYRDLWANFNPNNLSQMSTVPVTWRMIPADDGFYYLTTDMAQNPGVVTVPPSTRFLPVNVADCHVKMAALRKGDHWQMWQFIPV